MTAFGDWVTQTQPDVEVVTNLLREPLSDNPTVLSEQMRAIEAWQGRMLTLLAVAGSFLDAAQQRELAMINPDLRALDREVRLRVAVAHERRVRDVLDGICTSIKNRLFLAMNLRKQAAGERTDWHP